MNFRGPKGCENNPQGVKTAQGRCHVCVVQAARKLGKKHTDDLSGVSVPLATIEFCPICCHWFCSDHWYSVVERAWGFLKKIVKGSQSGCCGPKWGE